MQKVRIFPYGTRAQQEGRARDEQWVLEAEPAEPQRPDPVMGWAGSGDTDQQLRLLFPTKEAAIAYAERQGLQMEVMLPEDRPRILQSYGDNFLHQNRGPR